MRDETLLESDLIRSVLDGFSDPAFLLDRGHRIRQVNRAWRLRFGQGDEVLGQRCHEVLHHEPVACAGAGLECPLEECVVRQRSVHCLHVHHGPEHAEHHHVSVHPVRVRDGEMVGFLQTFHALPAASAVAHARRLVGRSPAFLAMLDGLRRAAEHDLPVLLLGEAGAGKRLAAETLHQLGDRRHGPLVTIDTAGLAERPDPSRARPAPPAFADWNDRLATAGGGTLVVHEIGDLPRPLQADLSERLGRASHGEAPRAGFAGGDFRLLATSSRDPGELVRSGALLAELFARIAVAPILVPALRDRMEDLPLLTDSLLERTAGGAKVEIEPETRRLLASYCFPGNVAELLHLLERARLLADGDALRPEHVHEARRPCDPLPGVARPSHDILPLADVERRYLDWALHTFDGSRGELAAKLGLAERTLFRKLRELKEHPPAIVS